jgi:hypothetical protein
MTKSKASNGRATREKREKVAISVPASLLATARERVAAGAAPSLSAVVTQALAQQLVERDTFEQLVDEMLARGELVITNEDREWARQSLAR